MSEFDSSAAVHKSRAGKLASLIASGGERARLWRAEELAAIFRHQMSAPMTVDLGAFDARTAERLRTVTEAQGLLLKSFGDLFQHPTPPVELLEMVKDFAKANVDQPDSGLPAEIAAVVYYTCIAAALVRLDTRISQLSDAGLQRGLRGALGQSWVDEATKGLLARALDKISSGQKGGGT